MASGGTPGPPPAHSSFPYRWTLAFPYNVQGRRVAHSRGFIPQSGSPSYSRPMRFYEAASFVFVLRPAGSAGTPDWVRGAVSGQVPPGCYHPSAPSAYTPIRALGVMNSFQFISRRTRYLVHVASHRTVEDALSAAFTGTVVSACWPTGLDAIHYVMYLAMTLSVSSAYSLIVDPE